MFRKIKNKNYSTFFLIIASESNSVDAHRKLQYKYHKFLNIKKRKSRLTDVNPGLIQKINGASYWNIECLCT